MIFLLKSAFISLQVTLLNQLQVEFSKLQTKLRGLKLKKLENKNKIISS